MEAASRVADEASTSGAAGGAAADAPPPPKKRLPPGKRPYDRVTVPTAEQIMQEDVMNNCALRTVLSGAMGAGLGVMFGVFMGTMDGAGMGPGGSLAVGPDAPKQSAREVLRDMARTAVSRSRSYAKGFAAMGALFAGSECVIEKARARHDVYNSVYAGCATGAVLAHGGGPKAMGVGCATFAAFSAAIDRFMGSH